MASENPRPRGGSGADPVPPTAGAFHAELLRLCGLIDEALRPEVVQAATLKFMQRDHVRKPVRNMRAFARRVLLATAATLGERAQEHRERVLDLADVELIAEDGVPAAEAKADLELALRRLRAPDRELLVWRYVQGLSVSEIEVRLADAGRPAGTHAIESRLVRGKKALRTLLEQAGYLGAIALTVAAVA